MLYAMQERKLCSHCSGIGTIARLKCHWIHLFFFFFFLLGRDPQSSESGLQLIAIPDCFRGNFDVISSTLTCELMKQQQLYSLYKNTKVEQLAPQIAGKLVWQGKTSISITQLSSKTETLNYQKALLIVTKNK